MNTYDSTADTLKHIRRVQEILGDGACELIRRGTVHDDSKLDEPEKPIYDEVVPEIQAAEAAHGFDSQQYREAAAKLGEAGRHHKANNSHHPEYFANGIDGMSIFDVFEMLADWKAAGERNFNCVHESIAKMADKYDIGPQLVSILKNTALEMGWKPDA